MAAWHKHPHCLPNASLRSASPHVRCGQEPLQCGEPCQGHTIGSPAPNTCCNMASTPLYGSRATRYRSSGSARTKRLPAQDVEARLRPQNTPTGSQWYTPHAYRTTSLAIRRWMAAAPCIIVDPLRQSLYTCVCGSQGDHGELTGLMGGLRRSCSGNGRRCDHGCDRDTGEQGRT